MKEMFGKGFGFIFGLYAALVAVQVIDDNLPDKYKQYKKKETEPDKEVSSEE